MTVKLLTKHHLEFLSLKGDCNGSSESAHVKMQYCWKSHVMAQLSVSLTVFIPLYSNFANRLFYTLKVILFCHIFLSVVGESNLDIITVLPVKSDSDIMFCLQSYQGFMIDRSFVY